jgi:toll-like receptor 2
VFNFLFSGCIADRDFTPGVSVLANIVEAIHSSYKVILVLTDHFVSSQWCKYEADQAIIRSLGLNDVEDQDRNISCVIPVLLEDCKKPTKLKHLPHLDMTIEKDFVSEMRRLKRALLP